MEKKTEGIIRIALIGPESTAKSTLSEQLATYYHTVWVPEYSRDYLKRIDRKYMLEDVLNIAKAQLEREQELLKRAKRFLFADTELIIAKVWCEDVFQTCPPWITENLRTHQYDLYLLTYPDLPWLEDPLRENPHRRDFFFNWYERELNAIHANYVIIKGDGEARLNQAIQAIEKFSAGRKK